MALHSVLLCAPLVAASAAAALGPDTVCHPPPAAAASSTSSAPAAPAQCPTPLHLQNGTNFMGNTLKCFTPVPEMDACCALCTAEPTCAGFTWGLMHPPTAVCYLKTSDVGATAAGVRCRTLLDVGNQKPG